MLQVKRMMIPLFCGMLATTILSESVCAQALAPSVHYTLRADQPILFTSELESEDRIVHVAHKMQNDPGTAGMELCYEASAPLSFVSGSFADLYCYGDGTPKVGFGTNFVASTGKFLWYTSNDHENEVVYQESNAFFVLDVCVPKQTPAGIYQITISEDGLLVCNAARETLDVSVSAATIEIADGAPPELLGDVDESGDVSADDAVSVLKYYALSLNGNAPAWSAQKRAAGDICTDGCLDADDAVKILQMYAQSLLSS